MTGRSERQNALTFAYLESIEEREAIRARLEQLWNYDRYGLPQKEGGRYFYSYNDGLQNQDVVYTMRDLGAEPELLVDPNTWSGDGTVALAGYSPSPDGRYLAYLVQDGGSDWRTARILDIESGEVLDDTLSWLKFTGLSWARDGSGFYYSRYPEPESNEKFQSLNRNHAVYFHRIGDSQEQDRLVYTRPEHPDWGYAATVTDDGRWLVITVWLGTDSRFQIVVQDLAADGAEPRMLIEGFDFDYTLAGNAGDTLYFRSNNGAPRGRLIAIDLADPGESAWREIIPESGDVLKQVTLVGGRVGEGAALGGLGDQVDGPLIGCGLAVTRANEGLAEAAPAHVGQFHFAGGHVGEGRTFRQAGDAGHFKAVQFVFEADGQIGFVVVQGLDPCQADLVEPLEPAVGLVDDRLRVAFRPLAESRARGALNPHRRKSCSHCDTPLLL